jgi:serine/threonine protein kinase/Tfp pilus assembly protein PilF
LQEEWLLMSDLLGKQLGQYRILRRLGAGGFAVVYLGEHIHLQRQVAIKVLHQVHLSSEDEERFRKEARTIASLEHKNIIRVIDYGIQESTSIPYLVMEYMPKTLRWRYPKGTRFSALDILPYVKQVASGLQHAHNHKVIHRDVKPENMLLNDHDKVRLSDFGIAVVDETSRTSKTLDKLGTPAYMAPEQFRGKPVFASDQYSLGIVVYEWLCGTRPFTGGFGELLHQHESATPPSMREKVPSLSATIEEVIQKALAKNPKERYANIGEFALAFEKACQLEQAGNDTLSTISVSSPSSQSHSPVSALTERAKPNVATPPEDSSVIWNVPYRRNPFFTGRTEVLTFLHDTFSSKKMAIKTQAVSGLGGIGKTQIATEYVYRYHSEYQVILWVRGDTREKMLADIAALATLLNLKERHEQEQRRVLEAVRSWLRKNTKWLLIIDNIEDLRLVQTLLPSAGRGHILLTTRTQTTGNIAQCIDLGKMTLEESTLFLLKRTKRVSPDATLQDASRADSQKAYAIAEVLDGLPLALDQAGAYIEETGCSLSNYLGRYQDQHKKLLDMRGGFDCDHPASVKATFSSSLEKVEKISPAAVELLRFCAFLHHNVIPEDLILNGAAELGSTLQSLTTDSILLDEVLGLLRKFSLLRRHADTNTLSVHRLVQVVLQDSMSEQTQRTWVERTVRAINPTLPNVNEFSQWFLVKQYMPHVQHCVSLIEKWKIVSLEAARLLEQTGVYLQVQAQFTRSFVLFERAANMRTLLADTGPAATIVSLTHHFWHYYYQGQYAQAEQPIRKALGLLQQMPDPDQQSLAVCLGAMGHLCYQQGKYSTAEDYFLQALVMYEQRVGLQHPSVVCTFSGLGNVALALAKFKLAETFFSDALAFWQHMPEPQHPLMATSLNDTARLSIAGAKYAQAEQYLQKARIHLEQTLQSPHPDLASNLNNWALLYIAQGKYHQVEPLLRQSLTILEQTVGLQHPIAGSSFDMLGTLFYLRGDYTTAEQYLQKAQSIRERVLGVEHPDVLATINNLADVYRKAPGKQSLAEALYSDVLAVRTRVLGAEHPAVAQTLHRMAQLSYDQRQYTLAEELYNKALAIREGGVGKEHPDIARSLYGLATINFWKWKKFDVAETFIQQALAIYEKAQIPEHPDVAHMQKTYASLQVVINRNQKGEKP